MRTFLAMLALVVPLFAQIPTLPWAVSGTRPVLTAQEKPIAALAPSGDVYLSGSSWVADRPAPSRIYGSGAGNRVSGYDPQSKHVWTIQLGGSTITDLRLDLAGNVYVSGTANTDWFFTTPGAYRSTTPDRNATFACKLRGSDGEVQYCTFLDESTAYDTPRAIGADASGRLYYRTRHGQATAGALSAGSGDDYHRFCITKLDPAGAALAFRACLGPVDAVDAAALDALGNVTIAGRTTSADFPTTPNAAARTYVAKMSFVAKVNATGTALDYSTFGKPNETPVALALDPAGRAQILVRDENLNLRVRRYNADGSAVAFESPVKINHSALLYYWVYLMGIDDSGVSSILGVTDQVNISVLRPTHPCQSLLNGENVNGFLVRVSDSGVLLQSTFLPATVAPGFRALAVGTHAVSVVTSPDPPLDPLPRGPFQVGVVTIAEDPKAQIALTCVANAASLDHPPIAPGEIVSFFGEQIGPATPQSAALGADQRFPTSLAGTQVTFDGVAAPLLYVSDGQVNAVAPLALTSNSTEICVIVEGVRKSCMLAGVREAHPGIFLVSPSSLFAAAINQDGTPNSQQNPATPGSIVSVYATGVGAITPPVLDGALIPLPLPSQKRKISVRYLYSYQCGWNLVAMVCLSWRFPEVLYAGPAPFQIAGMSQVNFRLPLDGASLFSILVALPDGGSIDSNVVGIWTKPAN